MTIALEDLLHPLEQAVFLSQYWEREFLWQKTRADVRGLVTLDDVEYLISSLSSSDPDWIRVVKSGAALPESSLLAPSSFISLPNIYEAYSAGYTIQLAKIDKRWPAVGQLCRSVERAFINAGIPLARRVGSHLYLTPKGSKGLAPHYDNHGVFVIQVYGEKHWNLYGQGELYPVSVQRGGAKQSTLPPQQKQVRLSQGEVLFIPRGHYHEAVTETVPSLHVTLDIFPVTWMDLMSQILIAAPTFRESVPRLTPDKYGAVQRTIGTFAKEMPSEAAIQSAADNIWNKFVSQLDVLPQDGLTTIQRLDDIVLDTRVRRRDGSVSRLYETDGNLRFTFPGSAMSGSLAHTPVFEFLQNMVTFTVTELPELLSDAEKIALVRNLIGEGYLCFAE
jgi:ribosomal protein L16 Arg81 hydroxylase